VLWALPVADSLVMHRMQTDWGMKEGAVFYSEKRASGKTEVVETIKQDKTIYKQKAASKQFAAVSCVESAACFKLASQVLAESGIVDIHSHGNE
jgi:hypothetical protein